MDAWYKITSPRKEVREGRSFNPDEFGIHMEQIVAGTAPDDYKKPNEFFKRTCFTRALRDHTAMALRRLLGKTGNTSPVMALVTQFGGGKTHTLTTLYHLVRDGITLDKLRTIARAGSEATLLDEAGWLDEFGAYMKAVINLPGKVIPLIDVRLKLGLPKAEHGGQTCILVVDAGAERHEAVRDPNVPRVSVCCSHTCRRPVTTREHSAMRLRSGRQIVRFPVPG